jgi:hypothetical protein
MYIKLCANLGKIPTETLAMIRQAFGEGSLSLTRVSEWKSPNSSRLNGETGEEQSQNHAHNFL